MGVKNRLVLLDPPMLYKFHPCDVLLHYPQWEYSEDLFLCMGRELDSNFFEKSLGCVITHTSFNQCTF